MSGGKLLIALAVTVAAYVYFQSQKIERSPAPHAPTAETKVEKAKPNKRRTDLGSNPRQIAESIHDICTAENGRGFFALCLGVGPNECDLAAKQIIQAARQPKTKGGPKARLTSGRGPMWDITSPAASAPSFPDSSGPRPSVKPYKKPAAN